MYARTFTTIFLIQYFCLHGIVPFSKSYPEIESTWSTASAGFWHITYYIAICATLCVSFWSKSKATDVFPKNILKSKARDKSIQARKKWYCHVTVKNYFCYVLWKFLIKIESTWRREIKEQAPQLTLFYCGRTARSSHRRWSIKKAVLKNFKGLQLY